MERIDYLPLGSIVLLKGGVKKVMIVSRAIITNQEKEIFFDYGAVLYPEGMISEEIAYFNHENISKVIFKGYTDVDDENFVDNANEYLKNNSVERVDIEEVVKNIEVEK